MVTIMDMQTGKRLADESEYNDEVLNASWLPQPALGLQLQSVTTQCSRSSRTISDPDGFLLNMYRCQE